MSKYDALWAWIVKNGQESFKLTFAEIGQIAGLPIDDPTAYTDLLCSLWQ